jgi:phospholipase C
MYARYAFDDTNIRPISEFCPRAKAGQLPSVTFIDPNFHYGVTNDDHPPTSITAGQQIVSDVMASLQASPAWRNTLFILTYDEHGSIFDHVPPITAEHYSDGTPNTAPVVIRYGVRVPAIIASPWVEMDSITTCQRPAKPV